MLMPKTRRLLREDITYSDAKERELNIVPQHSSYDPQNELLGHLKWPTFMDEGCCCSLPWSSIIHWVIAPQGKQDDPISSCMSRSRSQQQCNSRYLHRGGLLYGTMAPFQNRHAKPNTLDRFLVIGQQVTGRGRARMPIGSGDLSVLGTGSRSTPSIRPLSESRQQRRRLC
jgi:hypothetical protein